MHELTNLILSRAEVQELVERMLKSSGRRIDLSQPFVDAMLPQGHRLHVVLEGSAGSSSAAGISDAARSTCSTSFHVVGHGTSPGRAPQPPNSVFAWSMSRTTEKPP